MCGICGKVYLDRARRINAHEIDVMRDTMVKRGPDAGETMVDRQAGLGQRRLAVIDLEASRQPMPNAERNVWITYNGEIYNFQSLRDDLIRRGHRFRTAGDTEVILHLYEEYGEDCVQHLRGMFAFAIWDARKETLFLARDRLGVKPLYYTVANGALLFASELKALLAAPEVQSTREIDLDAMHGYLSFLCVPDPMSIYRGILKLPAAHTLTLKDGQISLRRYWDVAFDAETGVSETEWCERILAEIREAVRIRLVSDVPLGAFLSGGIDSSTVVATMAGLMNRPVKTFSIGFSEKAFNEATDAEIVAKHLGTDHTALMLAPSEARRMIPELLTHFDEPFADSSALPTYFVSQLARREVTVALSGDGGDELFGGYPWRQLRPAYQRALSSLPQPLRTGISRVSRLLPSGIPGTNFLKRMDIPYSRYVLDAQAVFDEQDRVGLYSRETAAALAGHDAYAYHLPHLDTSTRRPWPSRMMQYDLKTYLPNDILTKVDRMSMYVSLEAREPLLDHKLVELAAKVPWDLKLRGGISKYILKQVIRPMLPPEILQKRKQGFSIPLEGWLRTDLRGEVLETLRAGNRHGLFDRKGLDAIIDDFFAGNDKRNHQVWTLYAFEHWYRTVHEAAATAPQNALCRA